MYVLELVMTEHKKSVMKLQRVFCVFTFSILQIMQKGVSKV